MKKQWKRIGAFVLALLMVVQVFVSDSFSMTADAAGSKLVISHKTITLVTGQSKTLKVTGATKTIKWSTSNKKVATVNKKGKVTAKKAGKATIKAKVGKYQLSCKVTVKKVELNKNKLDLGVKDTATLKVLHNKKKVTWSSSNKKVVTVNKKGKLTAKKAGKATIKAKVGKTIYKCVVTVKNNNKSKKDANGTYKYSYKPEAKVDELKKEKKYTVTEVPDGVQVVIKKDSKTKQVESGDVIVLPDSKGNPYVAMKVDTVRNTGSQCVYTGDVADYTDVFEKIDVDFNKQENFDGFEFNQNLVQTTKTSTTTKASSGEIYASSQLVGDSGWKSDDGSGNKFSIKKKSDGIVLEAQQQNQLFGSIELKNPKLYADIDVKVDGANVKVNKLKATVTEDVYTSLGYKGSVKNGSSNNTKQWYLGHKTCPIKDGFKVDIILYIQLDVNGEFSVKTKTSATMGVNYQNKKMNTIHTANFTPYEVKSEVGGSLGFDAKLNIRFGGSWDEQQQKSQLAVDIIGFEGFLGPAFKVNTTSHATKPKVCQNVNIYLSLNLKISDFGIYNVLKAMKLSLEWKVLDDNDSNPFRFAWHYEDGERVNSCTFGKDDSGNSADISESIIVGSEKELNLNWEYELDESKSEVKLLQYVGNSSDVVVYGKYKTMKGVMRTDFSSKAVFSSGDMDNPNSSIFPEETCNKVETVIVNKGVKSTNMTAMFASCRKLKSVDLHQMDTKDVTDMESMFDGCWSLQQCDLQGLDLHNVTNMKSMFGVCGSLRQCNLQGLDLHNVTNMELMFASCQSLEKCDLKGLNLEKVQNMDFMFSDCDSLIEVNLEGVSTKRVSDMSDMFYGCPKLKKIDFSLSSIETDKDVNLYAMFQYCSSLKEVNLKGISKVGILTSMFSGCTSLEQLDLRNFDTKRVKWMGWMFEDCPNLTTITVSDLWVTDQANTTDMFLNCGTDHVTYL